MKRPSVATIEPLEPRTMLDASAELFYDFNAQSSEETKSPVLQDETFFAADDGRGDVELWKSNGTSSGTVRVKDIRPGRQGSLPELIGASERYVFFTAADADHGRQLWVTDGTADGTNRVTDLSQEVTFSHFAVLPDRMYFAVSVDGQQQLWTSDGKPDGTQHLVDLDVQVRWLHVHLGQTERLLIAGSAGAGQGIWEVDVETASLQQLYETQNSVVEVASFGDDIVFTSKTDDEMTLLRLHLSDNTTSTIRKVRATIDSVVAFGDVLFFRFGGSRGGTTLYRSDGTEAGAENIPIRRVPGSVQVSNLLEVDGRLYFEVKESGSWRTNFWVTDGTKAGTRSYFSLPDGQVLDREVASNGYYFVTDDSAGEFSAWRVVGDVVTPVETLDSSIRPNLISASNADQLLYSLLNQGLWTTGASGTTQVSDGISLGSQGLWSSDQDILLATDSGFVILAQTDWTRGSGGLYVSDGTTAGTSRVAAADTVGELLGSVGDRVLFRNYNSPNPLWTVDSRTGELKPLSPPNTESLYVSPQGYPTDGEQIYFSADADLFDDSELGEHIWVSDGTSEGTVPLLELSSPISDWGRNIVLWNDSLVFHTTNGEIRLFDGTDAKLLLSDVANFNVYAFRPADDRFYFSTNLGIHVSDGTAAGTVEIAPGNLGPRNSVVADNLLYFIDNDRALWVSDGTFEGTKKVPTDLEVGTVLGAVGTDVLFQTFDFEDPQLWKTDGTAEGTIRLADVSSLHSFGLAWSPPFEHSGVMYFSGRTLETFFDYELWRTDGTEDGTYQATDMNPGERFSTPAQMTAVNGFLYFTADDGFRGNELWRLPIDPLGGDADGNGVVDFADFLALSANFGATDAVWSEGDFDVDGEVSFTDFLILSANFGERRT